MTAKFVEVKVVDGYSEGPPETELVNYFAIHRIQPITGGVPFKNGAQGRLWFGRDEGIYITESPQEFVDRVRKYLGRERTPSL